MQILQDVLAKRIIGKEVQPTVISEELYSFSRDFGQRGTYVEAISGIDVALWDLLGKLRNEPVYALLGGKTKNRLPVYCTTARPDLAKDLGFAGAKVPCPYGPSAGDASGSTWSRPSSTSRSTAACMGMQP